MADLPEYKARTKIEPAPVADASSALQPLSNAWGALGQAGNQFAQRQANEIARISGEELGRTQPGREPFPVVNETTAHFNKAYKEQEFATGMTRGIARIDRVTYEALKTADYKTMPNFDASIQEYIDGVTSELIKENAVAVREQLQAAYLSSRYKVEEHLHGVKLKGDEQLFKNTVDDFGKQIINAIATKEYNPYQLYLDASHYISVAGTPLGLSQAAQDTMRKSLLDLIEDGKTRESVLEAIKNKKKPEEILKEYANLPATYENLRKAEVALGTFNNYMAMTAARDNLLISQATTKMIKEGGLSTADLSLLKSQISNEGNFAHFETQFARFMEGQKSKTHSADYMDAYANNSAMLKVLGGDALNKGFQVHVDREAAKLGRPLNIQEEAQVAQRFDTAIPKFNAKLAGGINSKDAGMARDYSSLYSALARNNPNVVEGVDNTSALKAEVFTDALRNAANPEDAWKQANDGFSHLTPRDVADSKAAFQEKWKSSYGVGADTQFKNVLKSLGFSNEAMKNNPPAGIAIDFQNLAQANYVQSRDWGKSIEVAQQKVAQRYMETEHNGFKQIQSLPPTKFLPLEDIRRLEVDYLQKLTKAQIEMVNNPDILMPFNYELDKEFAITGTGITSITPGIDREANNPYRGVRRGINYKGEKIEEKGQFIFMSDKLTDFLNPGQPLPSWSLMFLPDNKLSPDLVYAPLINEQGKFVGTQNARFVIPPAEIAAKNAVDKDLMKQREAMSNVIRKMAAQIGQQYEY